MHPFFSSTDDANDPAYINIRGGSDPWLADAREFVEALWRTYEPYADREFLREARRTFHPRFWEMYLTCSLLDTGVAALRRNERRRKTSGPDIEIETPRVWIEAIAPNSGDGEDAVTDGVPGVVRAVPDGPIKLRLVSAISKKLHGLQRHRDSGVGGEHEPYVIAVNGASIPCARLEREVPRIVRAVFPIGQEQIHIDPRSLEVVGRSHEYRGEIAKISGSTVPTTLFQDPMSSGLSAIVYSAVDACNPSNSLGGDFVIVRNPMATNPLPDGVFRRGVEYWLDGESIRNRQLLDSSYTARGDNPSLSE